MLTCPSCGRASPPDAAFCAGCGTPLGATATSREVRKTVTALFCDLVGSTALGEAHDPEVLRPLLDRYFAAMRAAVERHGGRVEKFIGDAVSAVFGLPDSHEDDALRAVRAGMEMQERLARISEGSAIALACRVGVTTGEVLVPGGGAPLIGDAMNTASRLQSSAEPGSVVIGEPTWRLVRDAVTASPLPPVEARGKAEPVPAWRVLAVASGSPMRARRMDAPMVGRTREAALLANAFERAATDRACQLFTVLGVAGAGKSRLVEEFLRSDAVAGAEARIVHGRCLAYGDGIAFLPVADAIRDALGLPEFADPDAVRAAVAGVVEAEQFAPTIVRNVTALLGAGSDGTAEETQWAVRRLLETLARDRPLVAVLDDIHWGDAAFLELVDHLADWSRDAPILLLCMARPDLLDVRPTWAGGKANATTISLPPLSDAECGELIGHLLGEAALPGDVRDRITRVAEGNPLFVEEMLRMLVDDGLLVRRGEAWSTTANLSGLGVPPTVTALLSARLDRLSDEERTALEAASIAGKEFHRGAVRTLLPAGERDAADAYLRTLVRRELVVPERSRMPGEEAYRFRHILIRDATYDAIPKAARARLHEAFATWLEGVAGDRLVEQQSIVGYHLERAYRYGQELGLPEDAALRLRAATALTTAGRRALQDGDIGSATALLRPAAELARGDRLEFEALEALMIAANAAARLDETYSALDRLEAAAVAAGSDVWMMRARMARFSDGVYVHPESWDPAQTQALMHEAISTYRKHGAERFVSQALQWLASVELSRGNAARSHELDLEAVDVAMRTGQRMWAMIAIGLAAHDLIAGAQPLEAVLDDVSSHLRRFGEDRSITTTLLAERALAFAQAGRLAEAGADLAAARQMSDELGRAAQPDHAIVEGCIAWLVGDLAVARERLAEAHRLAADHELNMGLAESGPLLARVLLELGRDAEAASIVADFEDNALFASAGPNAAAVNAVIAARRGGLEVALERSAEAVDRLASTDLLADQGFVALDRAEVLRLAGRPEDARAAAEDALARFERKQHALGVQQARVMLERLG